MEWPQYALKHTGTPAELAACLCRAETPDGLVNLLTVPALTPGMSWLWFRCILAFRLQEGRPLTGYDPGGAWAATAVAAVALGLACAPLRAAEGEAFAQRGYYVTFMRMPTYGLAEWKRAIDALHDDGANLLLLWMGGAFRSKQFPITWKYNLFGIHAWGYNLCPAREASQQFMLGYVREMLFDFYPNADGLMIESSDYAVCHCPDCSGRFFDHEFRFVEQISREVWHRKPDAMIVVYPHYCSGAPVPVVGAQAARHPFDPRWTLFFTPHSTRMDPKKGGQNSVQGVRRGARRVHGRGPKTMWPPAMATRSSWPFSTSLGRPATFSRIALRSPDASIRSAPTRT